MKQEMRLKKINPKLIFGDYTGSWYPLYFDVGVNFASKSYDPSTEFEWATPNYKNYGYAEALDLFTTGNYYFEVEKTELLTQKDTTKKNVGVRVGGEERGLVYRRRICGACQ